MASENEVQPANEALFDALVRHQILLLRFSSEVRAKIQAILDATEADIADKIRSRLLTENNLDNAGEVRRLQTLMAMIKNIRLEAWEQIDEEWVQAALDIANEEPKLMAGIVQTVVPVQLELALPAAELLRTIVTSRPFEGRTLKEWASSIAEEDLRRIENAIRVGMVAGESSAEIARRVVGTARLRGVDGVTEISRRAAASISRTVVNHISNEARREFMLANSDLFDEEQFVATLDSRTTPICRSYDGQRFPVGKGPYPPLHFNCRSLRVAVLLGDVLGDRPAKPVTQRMLLREYARQRGIAVPTDRDGLPRGTKKDYDVFARRRIRELTGRVPGNMSYQQWLTKQPREFQDDVLGVTRARLFRNGGLTLDRFVNRRGDNIPLRDLARLHAEAFRKAGLDPEDFL